MAHVERTFATKVAFDLGLYTVGGTGIEPVTPAL
jgi:hypothetical protein